MTAILTHKDQSSELPYKHLVPEGLWEQFVTLITQELGTSIELAARRVNETIGFLYLSGTQSYTGPWKGFGPSEQVDEVWHLLMEKLREELDAFCLAQFGSVITHTPARARSSPTPSPPWKRPVCRRPHAVGQPGHAQRLHVGYRGRHEHHRQ